MIRLDKLEGIFGPTIQGEGVNIGMPVTFIRFYGCDFRCSWCDTPFALGKDMGGEYEEITADDILHRLRRMPVPCKNLVLSGGNPVAQQKNLDPLILTLMQNRYWMQVETQGSIKPTQTMMDHVNFWSVSPKLPSAGEREWKNWNSVDYLTKHLHPTALQFKFVVADMTDYEALKGRLGSFNFIQMFPIILQPEGQQLDESDKFDLTLYSKCLDDLYSRVRADFAFWRVYDVRILPQLHKIIWGKERRR